MIGPPRLSNAKTTAAIDNDSFIATSKNPQFLRTSRAAGQPKIFPILAIIMVLRKDELEVQLKNEHQLIKDGVLKEDSPLDLSEDFSNLCGACRKGDLKACQELISSGVNINARDQFDYTPLILVRIHRSMSTGRSSWTCC
jgi:hypothetical protein